MANGTRASNPSPPSMIERLRGKRTSDIRLPLESTTRRDPRLGKPTPTQAARDYLDQSIDAVRGIPRAKRKTGRTTKRAATRR